MGAKVAHVRGIDLAYEDEGAGDSVVLLLHGFLFSRAMWRGQIEALRAEHRVVALDLRGHGRTTVVAEGAATMEEMARDAASLLDELGVERATVCGLSMGGYVALAFYRLFRERTRALVLADTRAEADTEEGLRAREEMRRVALDSGLREIADTLTPKMLAPATLAGRPEQVAFVREMILGTSRVGAAAALRGMAARRNQTDLLPEIEVPALVIVGSEDSITPPSMSEAMARAIPRATLEVIEGAGHASNIERPEEFNRALAEFLKDLKRHA
ncbi:MAG TPA: alpha/beta fold hydrolase [Pyrinomonadaceae bacterium]|nr:alpha/beta fold hydrolase [Pyrinomonadaceae bacterium]